MTAEPVRGSDACEAALKLLAAPVVVIGAARGEQLGGMTAAWVTRVSHAPPLLLVAVGHERHTHGMLRDSDAFTVSILAEDQPGIGRIFGLHSRRERDKWGEVDHVLLGEGIPALMSCSARMLCEIRDRVELGDHTGLVGEVVAAEVLTGAPVLPLRADDYRV